MNKLFDELLKINNYDSNLFAKICEEGKSYIGLHLKCSNYFYISFKNTLFPEKINSLQEGQDEFLSQFESIRREVNDTLKINVKGFFTEIPNPFYYKGIISKYDTLFHYLHLNFKLIDFENDLYERLTISGKITNEYMLVFFSPDSLVIEEQSLKNFLIEFTNFFKYNSSKNFVEKNLNRLNLYANKSYSYLKEIPLPELPIVNFKRASICFDILVDEDYLNPAGEGDDFDKEHLFFKHFESVNSTNSGEKIYKKISPPTPIEHKGGLGPKYCVIHHSYETDLFAYKYQSNPPYYTKFYLPESVNIHVEYPISFLFNTEGRKESFFPSSDSIKVAMRANLIYTYFKESHIRVWHLILCSDEQEGINEYQLIKLLKYFGGSQENESEQSKHDFLNENLKFYYNNERLSIIEFFQNLTKTKYNFYPNFENSKNRNQDIKPLSSLNNIQSGIIQIASKQAIFKDYSKNLTQKKSAQKNLKKFFLEISNHSLTKNKFSEAIANIFCGTTLGILDFARMGTEEVDDTLNPRKVSVTPNSFLTLNRGILTSYSIEDDVFESAWKPIGMNPYLFIPNAVLCHNDYISIDAEQKLKKLLDIFRKDRTRIKEDLETLNILYQEERNVIDDLINDDILSNVFQYKTEQDLYEYGMQHRGIKERIEDTKTKLIQLDGLINNFHKENEEEDQVRIQILLLIISLFQIISTVKDYIDGIKGNYLSLTISSLIIIGIFLTTFLKVNTKKLKYYWGKKTYQKS